MKKHNKGYILIETIVFLTVISIISIALGELLVTKININKNEYTNTNLYLTTKSTLTTLDEYFSKNQSELGEYAKEGSEGNFYIKERKDIKNINVKIHSKDKNLKIAIISVNVTDINGDKFTLSKEIRYK